MKRKRFTIPDSLLIEAEEYCRLDHRTFSELICEAVRQHMHRYPKKQENASKTALKELADKDLRS